MSTDGASAFRSQVSYGASKYALESYSRAAAGELGPFGITVNIISLGPIQTGWIPPDLERAIGRNTPLGRVASPMTWRRWWSTWSRKRLAGSPDN